MKNKPNPKLPLHKFIALGGNPKSAPTTKGSVVKSERAKKNTGK